VFVNWYSALRFCNWLHFGKPAGAQGATTTEGGGAPDPGAYFLTGPTSIGAGTDPVRGTDGLNTGARFFLPTENQWYKAAYFDPNRFGANSPGYWLFSTRSSTLPTGVNGLTSIGGAYGSELTGYPPSNCANFDYDDGNSTNGFNDGLAVTGSSTFETTKAYSTDVGFYNQSTSAYGTFDQGGNVWELTETADVTAGNGVIRGGSWESYFDTGAPGVFELASNYRGVATRSFDAMRYKIGFRVAKP
jgi:hypothetical protein